MYVKLYKTRNLVKGKIVKDKVSYTYHEHYFASVFDENVEIKRLTALQKLLAREIPFIATPPINGEYENVKQYKKELSKRYNDYCCKIDDDLEEEEK